MKRPMNSLEGRLEVLNPLGGVEVSIGAASRLADLHGKTICELWNGKFRGDEMFPAIRELLKARFPDATVVPQTEFPICWPCPDDIASLLKKKGCDVVISGNGG
jgi:hypothetical protein